LVFKGPASILNSIIFKKEGITAIEPLASLNNQEVHFYPNPTKDYIKVNFDKKATVEIFTIQGQLLIIKQLSEFNNIIPVNNLHSGSYVVKILNKTRVFSDILIIE